MAKFKEALGLKPDKEVIKENEKWFKAFQIIPSIVAITIALACFVLGIVYMDWEGSIPTFWFGGAVVAVLFYVSLKIAFSYMILHIAYLRKMLNSTPEPVVEEIDEELPTI